MRVNILFGGALMIATVCAHAQETAPINLTMEHRHTIVESLKDTGVATHPSRSFEVGSAVPGTVQLTALPAELGSKVPQIKEHLYLRTADAIVLVSEKDRKVVEVIRTTRNP